MAERKPPPSNRVPGVRELDAAALKAFAHPLRMAMYGYLTDHGASTATTLAQALGESTGQTSYHLRQLERHGFVTDDPARGTGRERWWLPVGFSVQGVELARDPATRAAVSLMLQNQIEQRAQTLADWYVRSEQDDPAWVEATVDSTANAPMTVEETAALTAELMEVIQRHMEPAKARHPEPDGESVRRVRVYLDVFPLSS